MKTGYFKNYLNYVPWKSLLQYMKLDEIVIDANKYLHGYCDIFVVALFRFAKENNSNYKICWLGEDYVTIHCFAIFIIKNTKYYIDIRGITDSIDDFFKEFETRFDYKSYFNGNKKSFKIFEFECVDDYFEFTQIDTFENFKDFYNQSYRILENYSSHYLIPEKMEGRIVNEN